MTGVRQFKLDRWLFCLVFFAVAYGAVLSINLASKSMVWDEVTHLTGGLLLSRGQIGRWVMTNSLYPPAYDMFTAFYYLALGPSVFAGRLVAVTFSVLSVFVMYEIAKELYNKKTAMLSAVFFAVMPGIVWLSRMAMIETMLIFVFCLCMLFFFRWLKEGRERDRAVWITALVVGVAVKYQMLVVAPIIVLLGMYFWKRDYLKAELKSWLRLPRLAVMLAAIVAVTVVIFVLLATGVLDTLLFAIQVGTAQKAVYSLRYPTPIFYFVEMTWFTNLLHPIALPLYAVGLTGLGFLVFRRRREDKFLLLWFLVIYGIFTLIPNREWRYVTIAFPVLAIATADVFIATWDKLARTWQKTQSLTRKWAAKIGAVLLVGLAASGVFLSCGDCYYWVSQDQIQVPIEQVTLYVAQNLAANQTIAIACPLNLFNQYMVNFYLDAKNPSQRNQTWQYPAEAVDAYTPGFNMNTFVALCLQQNAKFVLLYEYGGLEYFNSTLTSQTIYDSLNQTGRYCLQATFGTQPNRVYVFSFT